MSLRQRLRHTFNQYEKREMRNAYLFLIPIVLITFLFILVPILGTMWGSLFKFGVTGDQEKFIFLENYARILSSVEFWRAFSFTLLFTLAAVALEAFFGLLFALLLNETFPGRGWLRAIILIPWAVPTIVSAKTWKLMYDYTYGVINFVFEKMGLIDAKINWMASASSAFWTIVIADVWKTTPFIVIILLAGLQAIPQDIYKQARIDGASMWKRLRTITLPLIKPVLLIALIFRTIDSIRIFDLVFVLTGGAPGGGTQTLSYLGYQAYNSSNLAYGRGMAISVLTFLISLVVTLVYIQAGRFKESIK